MNEKVAVEVFGEKKPRRCPDPLSWWGKDTSRLKHYRAWRQIKRGGAWKWEVVDFSRDVGEIGLHASSSGPSVSEECSCVGGIVEKIIRLFPGFVRVGRGEAVEVIWCFC